MSIEPFFLGPRETVCDPPWERSGHVNNSMLPLFTAVSDLAGDLKNWIQFAGALGIGLGSAYTVITSFHKETRNGDNRNLPTRIDDFVDQFKDFRSEMRSEIQEMREDVRGIRDRVADIERGQHTAVK